MSTWICDNRELVWHVTLWNNKVPHCNVGYDEFMHGNGQSPKVAHMRKAYGTIRQPKKSRNTLYKTWCKNPTWSIVGKIIERAVGRMIQI